MKLFFNPGCGQCVLLQKSEKGTVLIASIEREEFIVARDLAESGSWVSGNYFKDIALATKKFNDMR